MQLKKGPIPLYVQLAERLRHRLSEHYGIGEKFPTVEQLANEFGVAPVTVRQALSMLESDGLISRSRGIGTIVLNKPEERGHIHLSTGLNDLIESTRGTRSRVLRSAIESPPAELFPDSGTPAPTYRCMHRIHSIEGKVYAALFVYLDERLYQSLPAEIFEEETVVCALKTLRPSPIASGKQRVTINRATADIAAWLEISVNAPVAEIKRYLSDPQGVLIYLAKVIYRADFICWEMDFNI